MDNLGVKYSTINLMDSEEALSTIKEKGFLAAPVVHAGDDWWSGFRPEKIEALAA